MSSGKGNGVERSMIRYLEEHPEKILIPLLQHIQLVLITLLISVAVAAILTLLAMRFQSLGNVLMHLFSVIYSIPSLALFALLIPLTGLGQGTAILVMSAYNQYILLRNFITGMNEVDPAVLEAAQMQVLTKVQVPLSRKALIAGIRPAVVSTIGIGTIAAAINAGGLGVLLFDGLRTMNIVKILWGSLLSAALAILLNAVLKLAE